MNQLFMTLACVVVPKTTRIYSIILLRPEMVKPRAAEILVQLHRGRKCGAKDLKSFFHIGILLGYIP